jgi:hypothetical protein
MDRQALENNEVLSTFAAGYSPAKYFADEVSPVIITTESAGRYKTRELYDTITPKADDAVSAHGKANQVEYKVGEAPFACQDRALLDYVPVDQLRANEHASREAVTKHIMNQLLLKREIRVASQHFNASNYGSNTANGSDWTDVGGSPLADFDGAIAALADTSLEDSKLVAIMALETYQALRKHPDLRGSGADSRLLTRQQVADLLEIDEIFVSRATVNSDAPNAARTVTKNRIWSPWSCAISRVPAGSPTMEQGLHTCTFRYGELSSGTGVLVTNWDAPEMGGAGCEAIRCTISDDEKIVQSDAGFLLTGLNS